MPPIQQKAQALHSQQLSDQQVIDYLSCRPDILMDNPRLLAELLLPFSDNPTSLVKRQIEILRQQLQESKKVTAEINRNRMNERDQINLASELMAALIPVTSFEQLSASLLAGLAGFAPTCALVLITDHGPHSFQTSLENTGTIKPLDSTELDTCLKQVLTSNAIQLGPLRSSTKELCFHKSEHIRSAALVPCSAHQFQMIIALGHPHDLHYSPTTEKTGFIMLQKLLSPLLTRLLTPSLEAISS